MMREQALLEDGLVTVEEQAAMFLYTLSKNASNRSVQERFQRSGDTVSRYFRIVLEAISRLSPRIINPPPFSMPEYIRSRTKFYPFFKDCIGAIDGTHVPITIAEAKQAPYRNRKQSLSQNVMVVCDFDCHFTHVMAGWEGSASDATVLKSALDDGFEVPKGKYFLVDAGYANTPKFIAPYRGVRYHVREQGEASQRPQNYKELFNLRHSQLRNHIERIIGILKMRFPILKVATYHPINSQTDIVLAACVLHNFIVHHKGDTAWTLKDKLEGINPNDIVDIPSDDEEYDEDELQVLNNERNAGGLKREQIANQMWNDYIRRRRHN